MSTEDLSGRSIQEIVDAYRSAGYQIFYGKRLISTRFIVEENPVTGDPIDRLRQALAPFELTISATEEGEGYLIVRVESKPVLTEVVVCSSELNKAVARASVVTNLGRNLTTDTQGMVYLRADEEVELISHPSYGSFVPASPRDQIGCAYSLEPLSGIEEVVVSSSRYRLNRALQSRSTIESEQLANTVELGGDAMRIVNRLPGVSSVGVSAKPYIRGGNQDELLVLFNNVELIDPFHLKDFQSIFSGLNPVVVDAIDVYTGGFPARYGNRMSGVMDVTSVTNTDGFAAEVGLSAYSSQLSATDTFAEGRGSWMAAARRGNLDWVTRRVNPDVGEPAYHDGYGLVDYTTSSGNEFQLGWLTYSDDVTLNSLDDGEGRSASSQYENHYVWLQSEYQLGSVDSRTLVSIASIDNERFGILNDLNPDEGIGELDDDRHHDLFRIHQSFDFELTPQQDLELGFGVEYQKASYKYRLRATLGELAQLLGRERDVQRDIRATPEGSVYHVYGTHRWQVTDKWILESGVRWDYQDYYFGSSEQQLSPRVSLLYKQGDHTSWRLSAGRFYQPEAIHELQLESTDQGFQKSQYSEQIVLGLDQHYGNAWTLRFEAYYKRVKRPKRRFENLFNAYILIPELSPDRIEVSPEEVRARGVEFNLSYDSNPVSAWLGGTIASVDDRLSELGWTARAWDQRMTVNSGIRLEGQRWSFSAAMTWHSGWKTSGLPTSPLTSLGDPIPISRNQKELPNYFSFDLRYAHRWNWPRQSLEVFAELTNAFDRQNVGSVEPELELQVGGAYTLTTVEENLFPRVPSIGFVWRFE